MDSDERDKESGFDVVKKNHIHNESICMKLRSLMPHIESTISLI